MTSEEKMKICETCEFFSKYMKDFCGKCGCYLPLKTKLPIFKCPLRRW